MKKLCQIPGIAVLILVIIAPVMLMAQLRPNIYFEPSACEATLAPNDSAVVHTVLHNNSPYAVEFSFPGYTSKGQGGPDDFGYSWIDSEQDGGPNWEWTDISETGDLVEGLFDDLMVGPFTLPFTFPYYGQEKNHYWISPNGVISFDEQMIPFVNGEIPTNSNYVDFIAWFWDDLKMDSTLSRVYVQNYDSKTVVQFTKMVHYPGTESFITGQVIMMMNGTILIKYRLVSADFNKTSATVGLQSWDPSMGLQVVYNAEYVHSELAVRFDLNRNFITSVSPASLTLQPNTQETIWITYNSTGFAVGSYEQDLKCLTSHPELPFLMHHNVMHVQEAQNAGFKGYVTDAVTGYAINDVLVQAGDHQTYTNNNGFYELPLAAGSYNVHFTHEGYQQRWVEDTTAGPGWTILSVTLEPSEPPTYFLVGRVFAGDNYLESGFAYGYKMIEEEVVDVYADMVGEEGWYEFTGLAPAGYIVKAEPSINSQFYGDYLPTYYGDVIHWEDATLINLTGNTDGAQIHLVPDVSAPQGPGHISGTVTNSSRTSDVPVILRTLEPSSVTMTMTAADGTFSFDNLASGTYEIFAEIPGKSTTPMVVELTESSPSAENIDMLITTSEIIFLGIDESAVFENIPYIYPNPVQDQINIVLNLKKETNIKVDITDLSGRIISSENYNLSGMKNVQLDASGLSHGMYLVKIIGGDEVLTSRIIKN